MLINIMLHLYLSLMLVQIMITYDVEVQNSFNPDLQLKDTGSTIRKRLKDFMAELRWFKFVTAMGVDFKKQKVKIKQYIARFFLF